MRIFASAAATTLIAAGVWLAIACSGGSRPAAAVAAAPPADATEPGPAAQAKYTAGAVSNGGSIAGTITVEGEIPEAEKIVPDKDEQADRCGAQIADDSLIVNASNKGVKDALVYIEGIASGKEMKVSTKVAPAILDQKGCMFTPHVLVVNAGSVIEFRNSVDPISHNTNVASKFGQGFNKLFPIGASGEQAMVKEPEMLPVNCDIHKWMTAKVWVMGNPYWALTDGSGGFKIDQVPPGTYEVKVWHDKLKATTVKVTVEAGKEAKVDAALAGKPKRRGR